MKVLDTVREYWPHDDSPGYTDYPQVDIKAHRDIAKTNLWIAIVMLLLGVTATLISGQYGPMIGGSIVFVLLLWNSTSLRLQALEWEVELHKDHHNTTQDGDPE